MESVKPQKSRIREHLVRSRDGLSKCPNMKKTGRDVSIIDGCYFARVLTEDERLHSLSRSCIHMLFCCVCTYVCTCMYLQYYLHSYVHVYIYTCSCVDSIKATLHTLSLITYCNYIHTIDCFEVEPLVIVAIFCNNP